MRTQQEMFSQIISIASQDEGVRGVYMNGSRTNADAPKDIFQDYDIVFFVHETKRYYEDASWIDSFGERLYMQMPENMDFLRGREYNFDEVYGWLIQFTDGNRLDLHVVSIEYALKHILEDKLCIVLMDKDEILPKIGPATDIDYHVKKPTENDFFCDCNNFWWCLNNVAKGLWREEIPYVMDMINETIRPHLVNLLSWKIGFETSFSCSVGKSGKYMYRYVSHDIWQRFLKTYSDADVSHIWTATFIMCELFDEVAREVSKELGCAYNNEEARASMYYLEQVKSLPKDAKEVFKLG